MSNTRYQFKKIDNKKWGIYFQDRLLATVGSYEVCQSLEQSLSKNLSQTEHLKIAIAYKRGINNSLIVEKSLVYK
jgi:hypothetical protein